MKELTGRRSIFTAQARFSLKRRPAASGTAAPAKGSPAEEAKEKAEQVTLEGYPIVWNVLSKDRGGYAVRLLPGSATFTTPTLALWNHQVGDVIGSTANGTLRLTADDVGIRAEIDLPDTQAGRDAAELVREKYVTGMSFAWTDTPDAFASQDGGQAILNVRAFTCDEVTITGVPAFTQTGVRVATETGDFASTRRKHAQRLDRLRLDVLTIP